MNVIGVGAGVAVAGGIAVCHALPYTRTGALVLACASLALFARNSRSWFLVPFALGLLASTDAMEARESRRIRSPQLVSGWTEIVAREGKSAIVRANRRRIIVAGADSLGLAPGVEVRGLLRVDPVVGLEEPAGFRAERWARTRALDGRARFLGGVEERRPARGVGAFVRRAAERARGHVRARLEGGEGPAGELLVALLLGDRSGLEPADREAFRRAGLAHVLALSGMHVSLLAMGAGALLGALRVNPRIAFVLLAAFLAWFTFMTGLLAPVVRACASAFLAGFGMLVGRRTHALHALGLVAAAMLLHSPVLLEDLGFRLSFVATGVLLLSAGAPRARGRARGAAHGARRGIVEGLRVSTAIALATAPDLAESVGRSSVLAPVTNLASAMPSFGALGWGAVAGLAPLPEVASHVVARAARQAASLLLALCRVAAPLPGADVAITPLPAPAAIAFAGLAGCLARKRWPGARAVRALGLCVALATLRAAPALWRERITFLDVGQGDAMLVERGRCAVLIDAGPPEEDAIRAVTGRTQVGDACLRRGIARLDVAILSHGHLDHAGALAAILRAGAAKAMLVPPRSAAEKAPELVWTLEALADSAGIPRGPAPVRAHPRRLLGGALLACSAWPAAPPLGALENDLSIVARWTGGEWDALVTGDLEGAGERALLEDRSPLTWHAWLLKAGHHGGRTSTSDALLARIRPRVVVFSCGARNPHGHPHEETLSRCRARGVVILRTDLEGTISMTRTARGARVRWERADRPDAGLGSSAGFP